MKYFSTRGGETNVSSTKAMLNGLAQDGGLYIFDFNALKPLDLKQLHDKSYHDIAKGVLKQFFPEIVESHLDVCVHAAYNVTTFSRQDIVPVVNLYNGKAIAELFHGRTMAFKDLALSLFPYLLQEAKRIERETRQTCILTATSGDTGKAAMEGFRDIEGMDITVFYPTYWVSPFQKEQMAKQVGKNVHVYGIGGNFDDAQQALKAIFVDEDIKAQADAKSKMLASANSINIGRLLPQVVYYVSSYLRMVDQEIIAFGEPINIVVPTGNFGNIFAGYIASKMGVPIKTFMSASNNNRILADFFQTGKYTLKDRDFYVTSSPSMDILISSNFERYLFAVLNQDVEKTNAYMETLKTTGEITLDPAELAAVQQQFYGDVALEEEVAAKIQAVYEDEGYLLDPHTAVAYVVADKYIEKTGDHTPQLIMATAHPYKFSRVVAESIGSQVSDHTALEIQNLYKKTSIHIPEAVTILEKLPERFTVAIDKTNIKDVVMEHIMEDAQ